MTHRQPTASATTATVTQRHTVPAQVQPKAYDPDSNPSYLGMLNADLSSWETDVQTHDLQTVTPLTVSTLAHLHHQVGAMIPQLKNNLLCSES
ncbi:hypothetical protein GDO81_001597 [Engystomops pustulosus]|uniref:Uncharacterized protein n=1 Tax=Engystomops pustulosus TaxID=76066 RepID=A0AAV7DE04_ENGPU|nr:hypothetical protein GDO81_001597 [Engystomops pustulosus]